MSEKMREILIEKVTVNIGVGAPGERLENAKDLISKLTGGRKPIETTARRREPVFKLRKGMPIGTKVTLRGPAAKDFVDKALAARRRMLKESNFDRCGNFSFGVAEYIDFPGAKYDPSIGMFGFDICVSLAKRGRRVSMRKIRPASVGKGQKISRQEAIDFVRNTFNVKFE